MKKQRTKKATTGERIAAKAFCPEYYDISGLASRIDRAIAAAVRKERVRCVKILADDFGTLNPGRVSVTIAKIRSGQ